MEMHIWCKCIPLYETVQKMCFPYPHCVKYFTLRFCINSSLWVNLWWHKNWIFKRIEFLWNGGFDIITQKGKYTAECYYLGLHLDQIMSPVDQELFISYVFIWLMIDNWQNLSRIYKFSPLNSFLNLMKIGIFLSFGMNI